MEAGDDIRFSVAALAMAGEKLLNEPRPAPDLFLTETEIETIIWKN
jgi:hypothetical protein